jgi:hypothetical protein
MKYKTDCKDVKYLYSAFSTETYTQTEFWTVNRDFKLDTILRTKKLKEFVVNPVLSNELPLKFKLDTTFNIKK